MSQINVTSNINHINCICVLNASCITGLHPQSPRQFACQTSSASLASPTPLLPQSRDNSCYVSRPILTPLPLWLQKHIDLRAHEFAHSANLWHQPWLADITYAWSLRLYRNKFCNSLAYKFVTAKEATDLNISPEWVRLCNYWQRLNIFL
jgi:hypothetical protein